MSFWQADFRIYVYHLSHVSCRGTVRCTTCLNDVTDLPIAMQDGASEEHTDDSADAVAACEQWVLPAVEFDGLWESYVATYACKLVRLYSLVTR